MLVINSQDTYNHIGNSQFAGFRHNKIMKWPNRIKELSESLGWRQADLARSTGLEPPIVGRFWHGQRKLHQDHLDVFAKAFHCRPEEIIGSPIEKRSNEELTSTEVALLYALKAVIRAVQASKGQDKSSMLKGDFQYALSHYRAENKPAAASVMDDLLLFVNDPQRQEERTVIRRLLQLSPGSHL